MSAGDSLPLYDLAELEETIMAGYFGYWGPV